LDAFIAVLGTLLGGLLGAIGTYMNQRAAHRSEAGERLSVLRRQVYLQFMAAVHELYGEVDDLHRAHRDGALDDATTATRLGALSSRATQTALEDVRLVGGDDVVDRAETLFELMRREKPPLGQDLQWPAYRDWQGGYWRARKALTEAARSELGFDDGERDPDV
jgi:hypothetical protein